MHPAERPTAIVINDDPIQLRCTSLMLEEHNLYVISCQSAEEALHVLSQYGPVGIIVTDLHMPNIDGWRLCKLLRSPEYAAFNHIPILVVSATYTGGDAAQITADLGANAFLPVPFDTCVLRDCVQKLLAGRPLYVAKTVLIVEDSPTLAAVLRKAFEAQGYTAHVALTGAEGRRLFWKQTPEIAILDYHLPDIMGDQLLEEFKQAELPPIVLMMTTNPTPELALRCMRLGADGYVRKPFAPTYVLDLCAKARRERALLHVEELLEKRTRELQASEAKFRLLFDRIPEAVIVYDANGVILNINSVGAQWLEKSRQTLIGTPLSDVLEPQEAAQVISRTPRILAAGSDCFEMVYVSHTGRRLEVEANNCAIEFEGQPAVLSVARDITERKRAVAALQAAKDYAENIINSSLNIIVSVDKHRRIIEFNRAAQHTFGYSKEEVLGKPVNILYAHPAQGNRIHHSSLQEGRFTGEITNRRKDGSTFEAYLSASVLRDIHGKIVGVMGISQDITARKQAETALQAAKEAAEAANRTKSAFLANVSHEIRTPMNGILGMTALALETDLTHEQREYLEMVKISAQALLELINDLLDFSKIEAGKLVLDLHPFSLRDLLAQAMKTCALSAHQKGLELTCAVHPDVPDGVIGDAGRLRQILVNLLGNAVKFTAHGEVAVSVECLEQAPDSMCLQVQVRDTGVGIPAAKQQQIFEPFSQADSSTARRYGGTGLGLSIAAQLVGLMGGRIWVDSTEGSGSTFTFTVHFGLQPGTTPLPGSPEAVKDLAVLVVDAHATSRCMLHELLQSWQMRPTAVASTAEALAVLVQAQAAGQPFAMVLLDGRIPDPEGGPMVVRIRQQPAMTEIPLLMLVSTVQAKDMRRFEEMGATACLMKPVVPAELWEAMQRALGQCLGSATDAPSEARGQQGASRVLRVLLAEDNIINQRLALRLLEKRGHIVRAVQNGVEVLAALAEQPFDLVLMDVQMPEMDGWATTAAIRAQEQLSDRHIPIIAMTAHAMQGDRERCLAAGMDGYVAKPLWAEELFAVMERLTATTTEAPLENQSQRAGMPEVLDYGALLARVDRDMELLQEIVRLFLTDCPRHLAELHAALARGDQDGLVRTVHSLKGALGNICAPAALAEALRLETAGQQGDLQYAGVALAALAAALERLLPLLTALGAEKQPRRGNGHAYSATPT